MRNDKRTEPACPADGAHASMAPGDRVCHAVFLCCTVLALMLSGMLLPPALRPYSLSYPKYFAVQTLAAVLALCLIARFFKTGCRAPEGRLARFRFLLFPAALISYALWNAAAVSWAVWPYGAMRYFVREGLFFFLALCSFLMLSDRRRWLVFGAVFLAAAFTAALLQALYIAVISLSGAGADPGQGVIRIFLLNPIFYGNPNFSVSILFTAVLLSLGFAVRHTLRPAESANHRPGGGSRKTVALWLFCAITALVCGFLIYAAHSRAGYIGICVAGAAYLICVLPFGRRYLIAGGLAALVLGGSAVLLYCTPVRQRMIAKLYGTETTFQARGIWWLAAADMMSDRPVRGLGPAGFVSAYQEYEPPLGRRTRYTGRVINTHPHNEFLRVGAELGFTGLLIYMLILSVSLVAGYRAVRAAPRAFKPRGFAFGGGLLGFITQSAFGIAAFGIDFALPFWLIIGLLASAAGRGPEAGGEGRRCVESQRARRFLAVIAAAAALLIAFYWLEWGLKGYMSVYRLRRVHRINSELNQMRRDGLNREAPGYFLARAKEAGAVLDGLGPRLLLPDEKLRLNHALGRTLTASGFYEEALPHLLAAHEASPGMIDLDGYLGWCYIETGRPQKAREHLLRHLLRRPHETGWYPYLYAVDSEAAVQILLYQVSDRDDFADPVRAGLLARFLAETGKWDDLGRHVGAVRDSGHERSLHQIRKILTHLQRIAAEAGIEAEIDRLARDYPELFD